jgi:CheY-like chemotaxis protein
MECRGAGARLPGIDGFSPGFAVRWIEFCVQEANAGGNKGWIHRHSASPLRSMSRLPSAFRPWLAIFRLGAGRICFAFRTSARKSTEPWQQILAEDAIDVAILDYEMPDLNGSALADDIRVRYRHIRILPYSGATNIPGRELINVDVFVPKGRGPASLVRRVLELRSGPGSKKQTRSK